jgi:hypothetical protein
MPKRARLGLLAGIVALTVASEKVSFTRVIEATPALRWLDMLGRRPVALTAPVSAGWVSASSISAGWVSAGSVSAGPVAAGPVAAGLAPAAEPAALSRTERLAWWVRRRRPGRHRRNKTVVPSRLPSRGTSP